MSDADLRGKLLAVFHERRHNAQGWVPTSDLNLSGAERVSNQAVGGVCRQLADAGLIRWKPLNGGSEGFIEGMAQITGLGVDVVERLQPSPISINFPQNTPLTTEVARAVAPAPLLRREEPEMSPALQRAMDLANEIEKFSLGNCGPSDDPDEQTAYVYAFRDIAKRFLAAAKRLGDSRLTEDLRALNMSPELITEAYDLKAELLGIIDYLRDEAARIDGAAARSGNRPIGFDELLHPLVRQAATRHYQAKDFRNAVLDAITAVFDKIRERTGIDQDGDRLINQVLSVREPILILSEIETQSGQNDQSGFADIFRGFYRGVRNPKAHSLEHDLDATKAGQHLVLASLLMRRIVEAKLVMPPPA